MYIAAFNDWTRLSVSVRAVLLVEEQLDDVTQHAGLQAAGEEKYG